MTGRAEEETHFVQCAVLFGEVPGKARHYYFYVTYIVEDFNSDQFRISIQNLNRNEHDFSRTF